MDNAEEKMSLEAQETFSNDRKYVVHSWSVQSKLKPIVITKAQGCYFWDGNGKRYLDMYSQIVNLNIGHNHPKVVQAIKDQADKLCYAAPGLAVEPKSTLAKLLSEVTPEGLNHFFFVNGGADANENAIKIARKATGKFKIISRYRSYHGATYGAVSLTGEPRRTHVEPGIPGVVRVFDPYCYRCIFGKEYGKCGMECVKHVEEVIKFEDPETIAGFIMEGITGSNGIFIPPPEYYKGIRELCTKYGILFIDDEVMSGFGRTGKWFAVDHFGVVPDIMTVAKGINSGYIPMGAVCLSDKVYDGIKDDYLSCGLTYSGHPMACAAAVATIKAYREEKIIENAAEQEKLILSLMEEMKAKHKSVGDVRCKGVFGCIELVKNRETREPIVPWNSSGEVMEKVTASLLEAGMYMDIRWNWIFIVPPCIITGEQLKDAFKAIDKALDIADKYTE